MTTVTPFKANLIRILERSIKSPDDLINEFKRNNPNEIGFLNKLKELKIKHNISTAIDSYLELLEKDPSRKVLDLAIRSFDNTSTLTDSIKFTSRAIDQGYSDNEIEFLITNLNKCEFNTLGINYTRELLDNYILIIGDLSNLTEEINKNLDGLNKSFYYLANDKPTTNEINKFRTLVKEFYTPNDKYHFEKVLNEFNTIKNFDDNQIKKLKDVIESFPKETSRHSIYYAVAFIQSKPTDNEIKFFKDIITLVPHELDKLLNVLEKAIPNRPSEKLLDFITKTYKSLNVTSCQILSTLILQNAKKGLNDQHINWLDTYIKDINDSNKDNLVGYIDTFCSFLNLEPSRDLYALFAKVNNESQTNSERDRVIHSFQQLVDSKPSREEEGLYLFKCRYNLLNEKDGFDISEFTTGVSLIVKLKLKDVTILKDILDFYETALRAKNIKRTSTFFNDVLIGLIQSHI